MFHFSDFSDDTKIRIDVCSGYFKHISPDLILESRCVIFNTLDQILMIQDSNKWNLPTAHVINSQSPKQVIIEEIKTHSGIQFDTKSLDHLCYEKTCIQVENEVDSKGNQLWMVDNVLVTYVTQVKDNSVLTSGMNYKWVGINELESLVVSNRKNRLLTDLIKAYLYKQKPLK